MSNLRILFLSENTVDGGHGYDMWAGMYPQSDYMEVINFTEEYKKFGKSKFESDVIDKIGKHKISNVFIALGTSYIIDINFLRDINMLCKLIMVFPDTEHNFEMDRYYAQCADLVWLLGPAGVHLYTLYGVNCVWTHGFDNKRYFKQSLEKDIDVSFIGGINRSNRKEYIDFLLDNGIKVELYGDGTVNGKVSNTQKNEVVSRSRINLNFTGVENGERNIYTRLKQAKGRPMEVSMSGSFMLSEDAPRIEDMFVIGSEIDIFKTKEELLDKINYYLEHDSIREDIAKNAYNRAIKDYETVNSFKTIIYRLKNINHIEKTYFMDKEFAQKFVSIRFYYMTKFFLSGKFKASIDELRCITKYKNIRLKNFYFDIPRGIFHFIKAR